MAIHTHLPIHRTGSQLLGVAARIHAQPRVQAAGRRQDHGALLRNARPHGARKRKPRRPEKPSDYWWLYAKVLAAEDGGLRCLRFETDKNGDVRVQTFTFDTPRVYEGYQTISPDEFDRAYARMLKHLEKANAQLACS